MTRSRLWRESSVAQADLESGRTSQTTNARGLTPMRIRTSDRPRRRRHCSSNVHRRARAVALAAAVAVPSLALSTVGLAQTWTATVNGSWSTASNWTSLPSAGPSTTLNFNASRATAYDALDHLVGPLELQQVNFKGISPGPLSVAPGPLPTRRFPAFGATLNNNTAGNVSLNGRMQLTNVVSVNPGVVGSNTTISGCMSGPYGPTIFAGGGGTVTLAGQNTFTGLVPLARRADVGAQSSLGTGTLYARGGTPGSALFVSPSGTPPFLPVINNAIDNSSGGLTLGGLFGYTLGGNITGGGTISLRPSNLFNQTWTLSGSNTGFTGFVNVQGS